MSTNATHEFPAPVGGIPDALDFAPSIVFATLYAVLVPVAIWRISHPRSRTTVLLGTTFFSIERVVSYSLRANAARDAAFRANEGIETYLQTTYSSGFIAIGQDLVNLLRALLVASTLGGDMLTHHKLTPPHVRKAQKQARKERQIGSEMELAPRFPAGNNEQGDKAYKAGVEVEVEVEVELEMGTADRDGASSKTSANGPEFADQTKLRKTIRQWLGVATLLFLLAVIVSATAGGNYKVAVTGSNGGLVRALWYVSTVLAVALLVAAALTALVASQKLPRVPRTSALWIVIVACLLSIVGIYRLTAISHSTTSLLSTGPGTQNSPRDKAAFYVLHAVPEFVSVAILVSLNARRVFGTGPWGDLRARDPKPKAAEVESGTPAEAQGSSG
ncbi:hypothetical protein GSI_04149 [Ganoderma sinense ZZ0214-1]|uniref:Uncharacterized protein n=1 Tax=Ganoderma sinense ZZ0214-1 TaxID=1077348 RepID=A0A2G8SIC7_9APHY|nr:hypothetical protein GSI_04149 [Ganoderma sinense ZZ0214-1]